MTSRASVGVIGAGHLIRHMMPKLVETGSKFVISSRNAQISSELAKRFDLEICDDNQQIVDQSEIVLLAVRPFHALDVAKSLNWKDGQICLSLCAGIRSSQLAPCISPAHLVMAMPVVAAEFGESPTLLWPNNEGARRLLAPCGPVLDLQSEDQFTPASVIACYYGWVQQLVGEMTSWLAANGVPAELSRQLVAQMTRAGATAVRERTSDPIDRLVDELATPRSFTLAGLEDLQSRNAFEPWRLAAGNLLRRFEQACG